MAGISRAPVVATAFLAVALCAAESRAEAGYAPGQEKVPDFARLVPVDEATDALPRDVVLERVTTAVPWGRGMAVVDGELIVLARGRHRRDGGVSRSIVDSAGTLYRVDTSVSERVVAGAWAGPAVRNNAAVFARPTSPPFHLYRYDAPPEDDTSMTRPYCALAFDGPSRNLFVCAYSGAELSTGFRKNATDAVFRYDLRDDDWHVVEQHDPDVVPREELGAVVPNDHYPHHDPGANPPPHGWVNGPDGCVPAGDYLYVPAKDNHVVVQYDLDEIRRDPSAGPPAGRPVLGPTMIISFPGGEQEMEVLGPGCVAVHGDDLYIGYRTSSVVVRVRLDETGDVVREPDGRVKGELIAVFEPWDAGKQRSGNLYDIDMSASGELFVSMGREGRIWRITPDPAHPFYGNDQTDRPTTSPPFLDMSERVGRRTGCNNIFVDREGGWLYVSSRANDTGEGQICGTIYRARIDEPARGAEGGTWRFDDTPAGKRPEGWTIDETSPAGHKATWTVIADDKAPSRPHVLALTESSNHGGTYNLALAQETSYEDLDLEVKVRAVRGEEDRGGGPVWRCRDADNYYVCRINPLESNYRVYVVRDGRRRQLDSAKVDLESDRWYELRVVMRGDRITCFLDGKELLHATDDTLAGGGMVGLWTKADAVTSFDDLVVSRVQAASK